ncbi:hypothetical protein FRB96_007110 [Tulasnella sp. 330]|nr:hypothetical protein FRB96_007110 [Tulasnella sp. 330]
MTTPSATVQIDPTRIISPVDRRLYSGFIEHLGRCIYGGLVPDESTPKELITSSGFRKDVLEVIRDELHVPVMRWPGGNYASSYRWKDGIGPRNLRPTRPELAWGGIESNHFGTDEFIRWCREANTEPYICLNMGTGTLEDALDWLEYCNGTRRTYWADQRRTNNGGRDEPYNVKYWALGNEMYGPWQIGQLSAAEYTAKAQQWAHALKIMDPSIVLISCGQCGYNVWDATILRGLVKQVDLHSIHGYTSFGDRDRTEDAEYERGVFGPEAAEKGIEITRSLIELARIEIGATESRPVKIAFDEWGAWDETIGTPENGLEQHYTLRDALGVASWLNVFVRNADIVKMANYAQAVNVIAPIITSPTGLFKQPIFHPLRLFAQFMGGALGQGSSSLQLHVQSPCYEGVTLPHWIGTVRREGGCKWIDASAVLSGSSGSPERSIRVALVNRHKTESFAVYLNFLGPKAPTEIDIHEMYHQDPVAKNSFEEPENVKVEKRSEAWNDGRIVLKKHSFVLVCIPYTL